MFGWLNRITPSSTNVNTDFSEYSPVGEILEVVRTDHNMLTVRLHGEDASYNSTLLEVDHHKKTFLIDELFPTEGNDLLRRGNQVHVTTRQSGIQIEFNSTILKRGKKDRYTVYQLQFPEHIRQEQRRDSHRTPIDLSNNPKVTLFTNAGVQLAGQLTDISTGGFGALFNSSAPLEKSMVLDDCSIQIKDQLIHSAVEIRFSSIDYYFKKLRIGTSFVRLAKSDRKKVEQLALTLQRERIKKHNDLVDFNEETRDE